MTRCGSYAEIRVGGLPGEAGNSLQCSRKTGHTGLCSDEIPGWEHGDGRRHETRLKVWWKKTKKAVGA